MIKRKFKTLFDGSFREVGSHSTIPDEMDNRHRAELQELLDTGEAELLPADPLPDPADAPLSVKEQLAAIDDELIASGADMANRRAAVKARRS